MGERLLTANLLQRLRRIEGQIAGLSRMVKDGRYCVDILHQIRAAEAGLHSVGEILLGDHLETCVPHAFESEDTEDRREKIAELVGLYRGMRPR